MKHPTNFLKGERHCALYLFMENNQNTPNKPQRRKVPRIDLIIIALGILIIFRIDWGNMNSFHYLILFMFVLCLMLRWANMRKVEEMKRKKAEYMAQKAAREAASALPSGEEPPAVVEGDASEIATTAAAAETPEEKPTE